MLSELERRVRDEISAVNAMKHVKFLSDIGNRFVGSKGDKKAIDYVSKEFKKLGLTIDKTEISVPTFRERETKLTVVKPVKKTFQCVASYFTPPTPKKGVTAPLVYVGGGEEKDYHGKDVEGKIAVMNEKGMGDLKFWMGRYAAIAKHHGALALISIHVMPYPYRTSWEIGNNNVENRFPEEGVPTATLSCVDGQELMWLMGGGEVEACLKLDVETRMAKSHVVRGVLKGREISEEKISIIAHRDNGIPPGANDNASGTGTMLEIARALTRVGTRRSVEFISCTAEEGVTAGAYQYVQAHKDEMPSIKALFNIDMISTGGRLNLVGRGIWPDTKPLEHSKDLNRMVLKVAHELGYELGSMVASWGVSESGRFIEHGVPAVWFWKPDDPYYHSVYDKPENLEPNMLKVVGDIVAITILRLDAVDKIPKFK